MSNKLNCDNVDTRSFIVMENIKEIFHLVLENPI